MASFAAFTRGEIAAPAYPIEVFLEVSNLCNARCVMCDTFSALNPRRLERGQVDEREHLLDVDRILADEELLAHSLIVHLYGFGEPTVHPRFVELVRRLGGYEVLIDFFTNGMTLADAGVVDALIEARVERVVVSVSGSTPEAYEAVHQGCSWDKLLGGLSALAAAKQAAGSEYPQLFVKSLGWAHHYETLDAFVALMADHGASVIEVLPLFVPPSAPAVAQHLGRPGEAVERARGIADQRGVLLVVTPNAVAAGDLVPVERLRDLAMAAEGAPPRAARPTPGAALESRRVERPGFHCMEPFRTLYVRQDGLVNPCSFAVGAVDELGVARGLDVFRGPGHAAMRDAALQASYPSSCEACLRHEQGPKAHFAEHVFSRYGSWYQKAFGAAFTADLGALVLDSPTVAALQAYARAEKALPSPPRFQAFLDHVYTDGVDGWAWAPYHPELRVPVVIWWKGRPVLRGVASEYRPDIETLGRGDGRYGFRLAFPDWIKVAPGDVVFATAGNDDQPMATSPQRAKVRG